jgi:hypothetical protein
VFSGLEAAGAVEIRAVEVRAVEVRAVEVRAVEVRGAETRAVALRGAVPEPRKAGAVRSQPVPPALMVPVQPNGDAAAARPSPQAVTYVWDVEAVDASGQLLVAWRGLRLRDAGPLPRNTAWPPSLLSVYLERSAVAHGLDPELRVTVQCGQPDGATVPLRPVFVVPPPSPPSDRTPEALDSGQLDGFALTVQAPEAAVCSWAAAAGMAAGDPDPDPGLADLASQVRSLLPEPPAVVSARLRAVAACLARAGAPAVSAAMADGTGDTGWLVLNAAGGTLACTVAEISGVSCPVAIAIMTPDAGPDSRRGGMPGQRAPGRRAQQPSETRS